MRKIYLVLLLADVPVFAVDRRLGAIGFLLIALIGFVVTVFRSTE
jgi:hypothetical protein